MPAPLSGAAAARHILDSAGLTDVAIEEIPGQLSDHYDPRDKVLRLSPEVYQSRTLAAVGIAAHEAGHALQDALAYAPLVVRNAAVPVAGFGSNAGILLIILGAILHMNAVLIWLGIGLFAAVVVFQVVNLPVEFNASARAKAQLVEPGDHQRRGAALRQQGAQRRRLDLRGGHAPGDHDAAVLPDAVHRRQETGIEEAWASWAESVQPMTPVVAQSPQSLPQKGRCATGRSPSAHDALVARRTARAAKGTLADSLQHVATSLPPASPAAARRPRSAPLPAPAASGRRPRNRGSAPSAPRPPAPGGCRRPGW